MKNQTIVSASMLILLLLGAVPAVSASLDPTSAECDRLAAAWQRGDWPEVLSLADLPPLADGPDSDRRLIRAWSLASMGRLGEASSEIAALPRATRSSGVEPRSSCPVHWLGVERVERLIRLLGEKASGGLDTVGELLLTASTMIDPRDAAAARPLVEAALRLSPAHPIASVMMQELDDAARPGDAVEVRGVRRWPGGASRADTGERWPPEPGARFDIEVDPGVTVELVWVPSGSIATPGARRSVPVSGVWMMRTEVTQALWKAVMGTNPSHFQGHPDTPVDSVSWFDAIEFANELTRTIAERSDFGMEPVYGMTVRRLLYNGTGIAEAEVWRVHQSRGFRLPTEAEWEHACRAGRSQPFPWGDDPRDPRRALWVVNPDPATAAPRTDAVGPRRVPALPNEWGLYDMQGNVWEWCWDESPNSHGGDTATPRIFRGGSTASPDWMLGAERRSWASPEFTSRFGGFRLCLSPEALAQSPQ